MAGQPAPVQLYVYDLSGGVARSLSQALLGQQIDGIWHTSVVVRGIEHYFGGGINVAPAGTTPFGHPIQVIDLGHTFLEEEMIEGLLVEMSIRFTPQSYSLFDNNCNNFSDELAQLLTGNGVPATITGLPATVLATPFGQLIKPMLSNMENQLRATNTQPFRPHHYADEVRHPVSQPPPVQPQMQAPPQFQAQVPAQPSAATSTSVAAPISADYFKAALAAAQPTAATPSAAQGQQDGLQPISPAVHAVEDDAPALHAAEKELEAAVAECALVDMEQRLEELDLKEGRATPRQQLGDEGATRLAAETAVKKEFDRLMAQGGMEEKEAEALAVEKVAATSGKIKSTDGST